MHTLMLPANEPEPATVAIGEFSIHALSPPFVIAEIGVNHDGRVQQARLLIDAALEAGASAVKFQVFSAKSLVTPEALPASYQVQALPASSQRDILCNLELSPAEFSELAAHCRDIGIQFLATPFGLADLQIVLDLGVQAIKIASTDLNNTPLIDGAIATGRPILLSTGASLISEIDEAVAHIDRQEACERLVLLHCISSYPTAPAEAALSTVPRLRERYAVWSGFSDHTESIDIAGLAVACGARILEKHLTMDRSRPGPDHAFSLTPQMFQDYVQHARQAGAMMGEPREGVFAMEQEVRRLGRKSVVSAMPIRRGQEIGAHMVALKRPAGGLDPKNLSDVIGRRAGEDIGADVQITWSMLS